ncbi:50S ribosomal protein L10 [Pumilibacter intestinalis]|uniref:50S ribosomal protein L10 n=1 Tax=Pumilibacter intestinalis TaxID=2941511 RepID=UPI0020418F09|nr:50S ribosomal protein L10 [Pumilibacter intestinalis]MCI8487460.1 50S ribosomal protein L10 [Clostridia bacterium]
MSKEAIALKAKQVEDIAEKVKKAKSVVIVDYRGLTVAQDTEMRVNMRNAGVDYKVLKNRLVLRALNNCGFEGFEKVLEGPTAVAFGYEDAVAPAKIVAETITKTNNKIAIKGGIIEGKQASAEDVNKLSKIPAKPVLVGQLLGMLTNPMRSLAVALSEIAKKQSA